MGLLRTRSQLACGNRALAAHVLPSPSAVPPHLPSYFACSPAAVDMRMPLPLSNQKHLPCSRCPSAAVDIWRQGSSLTQACSKSNCYKMPLGFVGQAVIIAGVQLVRVELVAGAAGCTCLRGGAPSGTASHDMGNCRDWLRLSLEATLPTYIPWFSPRPASHPCAAIILVLASLCLFRRCYVTRRTRRQDSASRRARAANGLGPDK